jgi:hypothetical protein
MTEDISELSSQFGLAGVQRPLSCDEFSRLAVRKGWRIQPVDATH